MRNNENTCESERVRDSDGKSDRGRKRKFECMIEKECCRMSKNQIVCKGELCE